MLSELRQPRSVCLRMQKICSDSDGFPLWVLCYDTSLDFSAYKDCQVSRVDGKQQTKRYKADS